MTHFPLDHVIESQQFDRPLLETVFQTALAMKQDQADGWRRFGQSLHGRVMAALFYEPSTRTRFSFESAMYRLGGHILTTENAKEFSSAAKGETLKDTILVLNGYADVIVLRHSEAGSAQTAAAISDAPVINAGDGAGQHPTQALLDMFTLQDHFGHIDGLRVAMVGDLKYGRTVRSLSYLLSRFSKIQVVFVAPLVCQMEGDIKEYLSKNNIDWSEESNLAEVLPTVDCVYMTRIQKERFNDPKDYTEAAGQYILDPERVGLMKPDAIIMHPLPRVDEIPPSVDDDPRAKYFEQARNGLYVRMALLYLLIGGDAPSA